MVTQVLDDVACMPYGEGNGPSALTPPQDIPAEQSVLGAVLLSSAAYDEAAEIIHGEDFYRPQHEVAWAAVERLALAGAPTDPVTVAGELTRTGTLTQAGGAVYLHTLMQAVPTAANVAHYARIVRERAVLRRLVQAGNAIAQLGYCGGGDIDGILTDAERHLAQASAAGLTLSGVRLGDLLDAAIDAMDPASATDGPPGITWGLRDVDEILDPLLPGQLAVIAAWSGVGKSNAGIQIARDAAVAQGKTVVIHTLEMSEQQVVRRVIAGQARVDMRRMKRRLLDIHEWDRVARARAALDDANLIIDATPEVGLAQIRASARRHRPDLIVVDQLPIMAPPDRRASREQQVAALAYGLHSIAATEHVAVLALAQVNRAPLARSEKVPTVRDLRESDAIVHAADVVILLHDPTGGEKEHARAGEIEWIVGKQRDGVTGIPVTLANQGHFARHADLAR